MFQNIYIFYLYLDEIIDSSIDLAGVYSILELVK